MSIFQDRLNEAVTARRINWTELCRRTGMSSGRISQYKTGMYVPRAEVIYTIADALDVDPEWLIGKSDTMEIYPKFHTVQDLTPFEMSLLNNFQLADDYVKRAICCLLKIKNNGAPIEDVRTFDQREIDNFGG